MKKIKFYVLILAIICFLIIVGLIGFYVLGDYLNKSFSNETAWTSDISVAAINPERVKNLAAASPSDVAQAADFDRVKTQVVGLGNLFALKGIDSIYILTEKEGKIYFITESTPYGQPLYVTPGKLYEKAPQEAYNVFNLKKPQSSKVYSDEFGTYISRFTPIIDTTSGLQVGVLGVDVNYTYYQAQLKRADMIFGSAWLLICLIIVLLFLYFRNLHKLKNASHISEQKTRAISDSVNDGVIVVGANGYIAFWNKASEHIFKFDARDVLKLKANDLIKIDNLVDLKIGKNIANLNFSLDEYLFGRFFEFSLNQEKGAKKYYELSFTSPEINGEKYLAGVFHDISRLKGKELELEKQKHELENLNGLMIGRELKMIELKKEIEELKAKK